MTELNLYQENSWILFEENLIIGNSHLLDLGYLRSAGVCKIYLSIIQIY